jgi:MFS transporter, OPA family, sugar phosphate sensor protein UhpC
MINLIRKFFAPLPAATNILGEEEAKKKYGLYKWSVFLSATFGYAFFYVCRLSLSVVKKPLVDEQIFTEGQLGTIGSALFFSYAIGKLVNGFFSDRTNVNRFISFGLLLTGLCNIALGYFPSFILFIFLWGLSGWFQSLGAAPCVVALTRWFKSSERGTFYGIWSASHNIGKAITFSLLPVLIGMGGWQWGFWGAGIVGIFGAIITRIFLFDSPESKGLPPPEKLDMPADIQDSAEKDSIAASQKSIIRNPFIWLLALSSAFMYISRYAIESWGIFYAQAEKGYTNVEAGEIIGMTAITGIIGTTISGLISDKFFKGSRNVPALVAGLLNILSIGLFLFYPNGNFWLDTVAMLIHGFAIGVLITFLGGLMAVDLAPKKAAGAAMGLIGIASYIGAALQEIMSGYLIGSSKTKINGVVDYDFEVSKYFWFSASVFSVMIALFVWKAKGKNDAKNYN